jgi:hypothetical protein
VRSRLRPFAAYLNHSITIVVEASFMHFLFPRHWHDFLVSVFPGLLISLTAGWCTCGSSRIEGECEDKRRSACAKSFENLRRDLGELLAEKN